MPLAQLAISPRAAESLLGLENLQLISLGVHFLFFIRDGVTFCLGPSLNFFGYFPSPVPYLSLIFQPNFDRLSLNTYFKMKCV